MKVAWLLLCYVLLEDYSSIARAAITGDIVHPDPSLEPNIVTTLDNKVKPSFSMIIGNVTVASGREAVLPCTIRGLGDYKVGWLRMGDQMILSLGTKTVNNPQKFSVSVDNIKIKKNQTTEGIEEEVTWRLHIRDIKEVDRGCYMCQINTTPMLNQLGCVDVLVRPDILTSKTEGDIIIKEGENATLECKATGHPQPTITWRKEKGVLLKRDQRDQLNKVTVSDLVGERLELIRVDRRQMGAYFCIAKNDVPPGVSKRVYLNVHFSPSVKVSNELVGAPLYTNVSLICEIEGFPKTINVWKRRDQLISLKNEGRYESFERTHSDEEWKTTIELKIIQLQKDDLGDYSCIAKSSMGEAVATLRLHEIEAVTQSTRATSISIGEKWNGANRNSLMMTTPRQRHLRTSAKPSIRRTPKPVTIERRKTLITTTTIDPRVSLTKDHNAFKRNERYDMHNNGSNYFIFHRSFSICSITYIIIFYFISF